MKKKVRKFRMKSKPKFWKPRKIGGKVAGTLVTFLGSTALDKYMPEKVRGQTATGLGETGIAVVMDFVWGGNNYYYDEVADTMASHGLVEVSKGIGQESWNKVLDGATNGLRNLFGSTNSSAALSQAAANLAAQQKQQTRQAGVFDII